MIVNRLAVAQMGKNHEDFSPELERNYTFTYLCTAWGEWGITK